MENVLTKIKTWVIACAGKTAPEADLAPLNGTLEIGTRIQTPLGTGTVTHCCITVKYDDELKVGHNHNHWTHNIRNLQAEILPELVVEELKEAA